MLRLKILFVMAIGFFTLIPVSAKAEYVDGMSQYRAYFVPGGVDPSGTEVWSVNSENCTMVRQVFAKVEFQDKRLKRSVQKIKGAFRRRTKIQQLGIDAYVVGKEWTETSKTLFSKNFKDVIEAEFNQSPFKLTSKRCLCACPNGYTPIVQIEINEFMSNQDLTVQVVDHPMVNSIRSHFNKNSKTMRVTQDQVFPINQRGRRNFGQVAVVHEFGHYLGLQHPGFKVKNEDGTLKYEDSWGDVGQYLHSGKDHLNRAVSSEDLMGVGMNLRGFYFDGWAEKAEELYSGCDWKVQ